MKLTLACWTTLVVAVVVPRWGEAFQLVRPSTRLSSTRKRYDESSSSSSSSLHAYVDVREAVERDIGTMDEWASACGVQRAGGFQLTTEDGQDWSVLSTENVAAQTPILFVPAELILSSNRVQAELGQAVQPAVDFLGRLGAQDSNASFMLFVKLLTMYEMGDQSPWYPWLNSMPRLYYNAPSMTSKFRTNVSSLPLCLSLSHTRTHVVLSFCCPGFCYECLPPLVFSYSRGERVKYDNFVQALDKLDILAEQTKRNEAVTKWAFNVVLTRAFGSEQEGKNIVPMADMVSVDRGSVVILVCSLFSHSSRHSLTTEQKAKSTWPLTKKEIAMYTPRRTWRQVHPCACRMVVPPTLPSCLPYMAFSTKVRRRHFAK